MTLLYLRDEDIPQICDLVVWASFLPTLVLVFFEAVKKVLVKAEQSFHSRKEPLQLGFLYQL